jgi:hypothetical protein
MQHANFKYTDSELKSIHINKFASTMSHNQMRLNGLSLALNLGFTTVNTQTVQMQRIWLLAR